MAMKHSGLGTPEERARYQEWHVKVLAEVCLALGIAPEGLSVQQKRNAAMVEVRKRLTVLNREASNKPERT